MTHDIPDQFEIGNRQSAIGNEADGRDGELLLHECCADLGFNMATALQAVAWCDAHVSSGTRCGELPGLIERAGQELHLRPDAAMQLILWWAENGTNQLGTRNSELGTSAEQARLMANLIRVLEHLFKHPNPIHTFAVLYAFDLPLLDDIIGHRNPASFAADIHVHREAVNKVVLAVQREFGLPPRRGQRDGEARKNMSEARLRQLKSEGGSQKAE